MELQEELSPADAVLLMSSVPERIGDLVYGLDEARLRYRHGLDRPVLAHPGDIPFLPSARGVQGAERDPRKEYLSNRSIYRSIEH